MNEVRPVQNKALAAAEELATFQMKLADESQVEADKAYGAALMTMLTLGGVTLALFTLGGWMLARSIGRQLGAEPGEAASLAQRVATGDFCTAIELRPGDITSLM